MNVELIACEGLPYSTILFLPAGITINQQALGDANWGEHYYSDDYWAGYSAPCDHRWELKHMFTSSYEKCSKCSAERDV